MIYLQASLSNWLCQPMRKGSPSGRKKESLEEELKVISPSATLNQPTKYQAKRIRKKKTTTKKQQQQQKKEKKKKKKKKDITEYVNR